MLKEPTSFLPAHVAVKDNICSWCRRPLRVQRLPIPHITIPICESCRAMLGGGTPDDAQ